MSASSVVVALSTGRLTAIRIDTAPLLLILDTSMAGGPESSSLTEPSGSRKRSVSSTPSHNTRSKRARTRGALEMMVSTSALRPKSKRARSIKGKEKAASSDEDEGEDEPTELNDVKEVAERNQNSASQSSSGTSSPSDAKLSSTTSLESVESSLARAQMELASKNEVRRPPRVLASNIERLSQLLKKQTATLAALQGVLQCQICLEMLWRPYSCVVITLLLSDALLTDYTFH